MQQFFKSIAARVTGFILIATLTFCVVSLVRNWLARSDSSSQSAGSPLTTVEHPAIDRMEPIVRQHLQAARETCDALATAKLTSPRQRGVAWGELGKAYFTYALPGPAAACFQNAQSLDPDEFRWSYLLAHSLEQDGRIEDAIPAMGRALKAMGGDATATPPDQLAGLCFLGDMAMRVSRPVEARRTLEAALLVNPECPFALVMLGQLASESGDSVAAMAHFQRDLQLVPNRAEIRALMAAEYRRQGDLTKAAEYAPSAGAELRTGPLAYADPLVRSVEELNRSAKRQILLGLRHLQAGRLQQAALLFARGVEIDPENAGAHGNLGLTLLALNRTEEAVRELKEARRLDSHSEELRAGLIRAGVQNPATRQTGIDDALAWRNEQPKNLPTFEVLANAYFQAELYQEALDIYGEAAGLAPDKPWPLMGQAQALAALNRHAEARDHIERALTTFPDDRDIRHTAARFLVTCPDEKQRDATRGLSLSQQLFTAAESAIRGETLALALAENGRFDEAVTRQRWAVTTCGDQAGPHIRDRLEQELKQLEAKQPCRERWPFSGP